MTGSLKTAQILESQHLNLCKWSYWILPWHWIANSFENLQFPRCKEVHIILGVCQIQILPMKLLSIILCLYILHTSGPKSCETFRGKNYVYGGIFTLSPYNRPCLPATLTTSSECGKLKTNHIGHTGYLNTVTVSPDGSLCASGGKVTCHTMGTALTIWCLSMMYTFLF